MPGLSSSLAMLDTETHYVAQEFEILLGIAVIVPCAAAVLGLLAVLIFRRDPQRHTASTTAAILSIPAWVVPLVLTSSVMLFTNDALSQVDGKSAKSGDTSSGGGGVLCCLGSDPGLQAGVQDIFGGLLIAAAIVVVLGMGSVTSFLFAVPAVVCSAVGRRRTPTGAGSLAILLLSIATLIWSLLGLGVLGWMLLTI